MTTDHVFFRPYRRCQSLKHWFCRSQCQSIRSFQDITYKLFHNKYSSICVYIRAIYETSTRKQKQTQQRHVWPLQHITTEAGIDFSETAKNASKPWSPVAHGPSSQDSLWLIYVQKSLSIITGLHKHNLPYENVILH